MKITPRPYQQRGIDLVRKAYAQGHRKILFWLATGGGKGPIFILLTHSMISKGKRVVLVMRRRQLIFQTQERFAKAGMDSSVIMGNEKGFDPSKPLQICSIDTVSRRDIEFLKKFDACIVDECHDATSEKYQEFLNFINVPLYVGLTATPFPIGKKVHDFWSCCVNPISADELRDQGFLVPCDLFVPPEVDLSGIKIQNGDFAQGELSKKMRDLEIVGDVINTYREKGENRPGIAFCVNKDHSIALCHEFNQAGIPAVHCDESTPQKERDQAIANLRNGIIKIICNVNIFSTGVDIPEAEVGIMARPTMSECLYIQQVGRLLRPFRKCGRCSSAYDNSQNCPVCAYDKPSYIKHRAIILDHGGNTGRHGHPYDTRYAAITKEEAEKRSKREKSLIKTCTKCFYVYPAGQGECPACGESSTRERYFKTKDGTLRPYDEYEVMKNALAELDMTQKIRGFKANWKYFKLVEKFGDKAMKYQEEFGIPKFVPKFIQKNKEQGEIYR
jgi:superfamily II DNA or RNA helicase